MSRAILAKDRMSDLEVYLYSIRHTGPKDGILFPPTKEIELLDRDTSRNMVQIRADTIPPSISRFSTQNTVKLDGVNLEPTGYYKLRMDHPHIVDIDSGKDIWVVLISTKYYYQDVMNAWEPEVQ